MPLIDTEQLAASIVERMTEQQLAQLVEAKRQLGHRLPQADSATLGRAEAAFNVSLVQQINQAIADGGFGLMLGLEQKSLQCWMESALEDACAAAGCP
jgi:hypothetical protein